MRKVLILMPFWKLGGAETQFRHICYGLAGKDDVILEVWVLSREVDDLPFVRSVGFHFKSRYSSKFFRNISYLVNYLAVSLRLLLKVIFCGRYDVTMSYRLMMLPLIIAMKICSKRVVFSERTASASLDIYRNVASLFNLADVLTCNTPITQAQIKKSIGLDSIVIYNGVELPFSKDSAYMKSEFTHCLVAARIHPMKNQELVLRMAIKVKGLNISFVGEIADREYYNGLIMIVKKHNLGARVKFTGRAASMQEYYENCDFCILPSLEEGMSNFILESMLIQKPILASNIPANLFFGEGRIIYFDPNNPGSLIEAYQSLLNKNNNELQVLLEKNFEFIQSSFSINKLIDDYYNLIR